MQHIFDSENAKKYGLKEAIIIEYFRHHILKKHPSIKLYDSKRFIKASCPALHKAFYFFSERIIERTLISLLMQEVLVKADLSDDPFDKSLWYAFKNEYKFIDYRDMDKGDV